MIANVLFLHPLSNCYGFAARPAKFHGRTNRPVPRPRKRSDFSGPICALVGVALPSRVLLKNTDAKLSISTALQSDLMQTCPFRNERIFKQCGEPFPTIRKTRWTRQSTRVPPRRPVDSRRANQWIPARSLAVAIARARSSIPRTNAATLGASITSVTGVSPPIRDAFLEKSAFAGLRDDSRSLPTPEIASDGEGHPRSARPVPAERRPLNLAEEDPASITRTRCTCSSRRKQLPNDQPMYHGL